MYFLGKVHVMVNLIISIIMTLTWCQNQEIFDPRPPQCPIALTINGSDSMGPAPTRVARVAGPKSTKKKQLKIKLCIKHAPKCMALTT